MLFRSADIYLSNGELNKQKLAAIIFKDEKALKAVNAIIHPVVRADFLNWAKQQQATCCAIESAILFDSGLDKDVDIRLMIYAPLELRIQRAIERDGANREAIIQRINNQLPEEEVRQKCDYIINNDDENLLIPQMEAFLDRFKLR